MKKVSVIIPAYNTESYMSECIESLVHQTLEEIEIIIVDDGSKDNTLQILKEYEQRYPEKIRVFHKENGGQASARNLALEYAKGEYLGFVDSDDWVSLDMYEKMYKKAKEENADVVVCNMTEHFPDQEVCHSYNNMKNKLDYAGSSCNKIFRHAFAAGITFPKGLWYEDFEYSAIQLMKAERVAFIDEGLYHYNCRPGSTMHNDNSHKNKDIMTVLNHISDYAKENGLEERYTEELEYLYVDHILITTINRLQEQNSKDKKEVIEFLRKEVLKRYPLFYKNKYYKEYEMKRRVVARLNAGGLSTVSKFIFDVQRMLRKGR